MTKLRRAVNRDDGVIAECPLGGGSCVTRDRRISPRPVTCGFYEGLHEDERGKFARCSRPEPQSC